jgi:hypothetical protein
VRIWFPRKGPEVWCAGCSQVVGTYFSWSGAQRYRGHHLLYRSWMSCNRSGGLV